MPDKYKVAHTGQRVDTHHGDNSYICGAGGKGTDFAIFVSEHYEQIESRIDDITIKSCSFSGRGEKALIIGTKALHI